MALPLASSQKSATAALQGRPWPMVSAAQSGLALALSGAGQAGGQQTGGENRATGGEEDALQGDSLVCRGTLLRPMRQ